MRVEWQPGDDPETHPMWEKQVELEYGMMRKGAEAVRARAIKAADKDQMTTLAPVRNLLKDWLPGVAEAFVDWKRDVKHTRGVRPIAFTVLEDADPYVVMALALRTILDAVSNEKAGLIPLAGQIGRLVEHELKVRQWEANDKQDFHHWRKELKRNKSTNAHIRKVNIAQANAHFEEVDGGWKHWGNDLKLRVGLALMDVVVRKTQWFEIIDDPNHGKTTKLNKPQKLLVAADGLRAWLAAALDRQEVTTPAFMPTVMPPKRWDGTMKGGYYTPYVLAPRLIRFKASQENQQENAVEEYDSLDMPKVYDAVHHLQETAWAINGKVLEVARHFWDMKWALAGMPEQEELPKPPRTPRMVEHSEAVAAWRSPGGGKERGEGRPLPSPELESELKQWKRDAAPVYGANARRFSMARGAETTLDIAAAYRDYEAIYFPHMLDFRGRMYPIPAYLQPQGDDLARGLLTFARGRPVRAENRAAHWLAVALASNWGNDKWSFEKRTEWVLQNEAMFRRIASDPIAHRGEWVDTDKPWQTLACVFEWVAYLEHGEGYVSRLPIMVDGTCNGIQHLSAMTRDEEAGYHVNLVPGEAPRDIYKFVANALQAVLERIAEAGGEEGRKASWWLALCNGELPRSLTKRQVMVVPYGGSMDSFFKYTREWLDENSPMPERSSKEDAEWRTALVTFLSKHMMDAVAASVRGGVKVMEWLQACAKKVCEGSQPVYWVTPAGFVVRHFYGIMKAKRVDIHVDGTRYNLQALERTAKLSTREQLQGIAPNFIHSLDASALMECLSLCREVGIMDFASVHDAYGTHAAGMETLFVLLREGFIRTHEHDVLGAFRQGCEDVLATTLAVKRNMEIMDAVELADRTLPPMLGLGSLDLDGVRESLYFFA